jgi:hypothetical protein
MSVVCICCVIDYVTLFDLDLDLDFQRLFTWTSLIRLELTTIQMRFDST